MLRMMTLHMSLTTTVLVSSLLASWGPGSVSLEHDIETVWVCLLWGLASK